MHNRKREDVESREIGRREGTVVGALDACIVALALYPGLILERTDISASETVFATACPEFFEGRESLDLSDVSSGCRQTVDQVIEAEPAEVQVIR
jgi:hypothetical protein